MEYIIFDPDHLEDIRSRNLVKPGSSQATLCIYRDGLVMCETADELELPTELESAATLEFCGLSAQTASTIANRWSSSNAREMFDFIDFAAEFLKSHDCGHPDEESDMDGYLRSIGVNDKLRIGLTAPGHDMVRGTKTMLQWVLKSMKNHYLWLKYNQAASIQRGQRIRERRLGQTASSLDSAR